MVQKSRREHLIPKLHLKRFARNGHVVVYLKQADALLKSPQGIATTARASREKQHFCSGLRRAAT
jgi:hypothetical protein